MDEVPLTGGRVTRGVVRVGDTVRRPVSGNSALVRSLLRLLEDRGFEAAPRYLGADEQGREVLSYLPGEVPTNIGPAFSDRTLRAAARLICRFHDATAGTAIALGRETVCHGDLSPCNFVFRDGEPVGIIDFDAAAPGNRLTDVGYALFLWLNIGTDGPPAPEQARRTKVFCRAYGFEPDVSVVRAMCDAVSMNLERLRQTGRFGELPWWQAQRDWLTRHHGAFARHI
jgi:tRNA A-37 threonylcarbamoyl transferase component Bud32